MTQRIYIVTSGEYSDYRIEAAYTTYEEALEAAKQVNQLDEDGDRPEVTNIEVFEGSNRMWYAEEEIEKKAYTLYDITCRITLKGISVVHRKDRVFTPQRATVNEHPGGFKVIGTNLPEIQKVLSDTIIADHRIQTQKLIKKIGKIGK